MSVATADASPASGKKSPSIPPAAHESTAPDASLSQLVSFRLGNEEYAVDIMRVQEIVLMGRITRMPNVPEYLRGLINLRGHVIPIVDLCVRFGLHQTEQTEDSRVIILNVNQKTLGIIVDSVDEVLRIHADQVDSSSLGVAGTGHEYVKGLVKFEKKLLLLLNVEHLLDEDSVPTSSGRPASA